VKLINGMSTNSKKQKKSKPLSKEFLLSRGFCCNCGCENCPYTPKWVKGSKD